MGPRFWRRRSAAGWRIAALGRPQPVDEPQPLVQPAVGVASESVGAAFAGASEHSITAVGAAFAGASEHSITAVGAAFAGASEHSVAT